MKKWSFGASWQKCVESDFSQSRIFSILGPGGDSGWVSRSTNKAEGLGRAEHTPAGWSLVGRTG